MLRSDGFLHFVPSGRALGLVAGALVAARSSASITAARHEREAVVAANSTWLAL